MCGHLEAGETRFVEVPPAHWLDVPAPTLAAAPPRATTNSSSPPQNLLNENSSLVTSSLMRYGWCFYAGSGADTVDTPAGSFNVEQRAGGASSRLLCPHSVIRRSRMTNLLLFPALLLITCIIIVGNAIIDIAQTFFFECQREESGCDDAYYAWISAGMSFQSEPFVIIVLLMIVTAVVSDMLSHLKRRQWPPVWPNRVARLESVLVWIGLFLRIVVFESIQVSPDRAPLVRQVLTIAQAVVCTITTILIVVPQLGSLTAAVRRHRDLRQALLLTHGYAEAPVRVL